MPNVDLARIVVWLLPMLFAITVHETAHGWVAYKLGDPTAKMLGRLTLNPVKHIDPIGTIAVPMLLMLMTNFVFGWAKPVPITWRNLKHPRRDIALVALAGPGSNFLMALLWALLARIVLMIDPNVMGTLFPSMCHAGILINLTLMILNILPIPPLDGSRVLEAILPRRSTRFLDLIEPYGIFILLALIATGVLGQILEPAIYFLYMVIRAVFGI